MIADKFGWWLRHFDGSSVGLDCLDARWFEREVGVKDLPRSGDEVVLDADLAFKHLAIRAIKAVPRSRGIGEGGRANRCWRRQAKAGRGEAAKSTVAIDQTDVAVAEAHHMIAGFEFVEANRFADQRLGDEHALALPHDLARTAHAADLVVGIVPGILDAVRHRPPRWRVDRVRRPLAECFVRTLFIVVSPEDVEASLLLARIRCRRARGLCLERAMHALVAAVLLRRGRMDECGSMPSLIHHADSRVRPPAPVEPNGEPLSQRIAVGKPWWRNAAAKHRRDPSMVGGTIRTSIRKRLWLSVSVSGSIRPLSRVRNQPLKSVPTRHWRP